MRDNKVKPNNCMIMKISEFSNELLALGCYMHVFINGQIIKSYNISELRLLGRLHPEVGPIKQTLRGCCI